MESRVQSVAAIVLAAGRSSRMESETHKLLLPLGGRPLVSYAVAAACASSADPVVVVLGYRAAEIQAALPAGRYEVCFNPEFASGMASSLRAGISIVSRHTPPVIGALIMLADQPLVSADLINHLLQSARSTPGSIIASVYAGTRSTPVYFPAHLFDEVLHISGDEGARSVIANHPELLRLAQAEDAMLGLDVDQSSEYKQLLAIWDRYPHDQM
jgi:molybdenum cofactor cytidylyltransferase